MKKDWRIMQLAIAACLLALTGHVSAPVEAQADTCYVPAARGYSRMIYDAESRNVYLFGGLSTLTFAMDVLDVWAFDTEERTWRLVGDQQSTDYDGLAFDTKSRKVIVYNPFVFTADGGCCDIQTWAYDPDSNTWQNMETANQPPGRWGSRMAYDSESDRVVLFGGTDLYTFEMLADTWAYDYESNTWTNLQPANSPPPHHFHDMVYHAAGDRIVMFGGYETSDFVSYRNDTWAYDANTNNWTELHPATPPSPRSYAMMAYEAKTQKIVMFGGSLDATLWPNEPVSDETWVFDLEAVTWTQASPKKPSPARAWYQMVGAGNGVVLFGGGPSRFEYNSDTYTYDSRNNLWKRVNPCEDGG